MWERACSHGHCDLPVSVDAGFDGQTAPQRAAGRADMPVGSDIYVTPTLAPARTAPAAGDALSARPLAPAREGGNIYVTQPLMPPLEEFLPYLEKIWESKMLTNGGPFHQELEAALAQYLGVEHLALFANGTIALVTALQTLRITGEVITTPFSFVATTHSLLWNAITPVFCDIDGATCNIDPARIEQAITPRTTAIMPVHCYGTPCDVDAIREIADAYGLKVIYDAAHAFGVQQGGQSVLKHGDLSALSFHATKVFSTLEGGALVCPDAKTKQRVDYLKNFGHAGEATVVAPGINGKMNEMQAAFGLMQLHHIDDAITRRRTIDALYRNLLAGVPGITCLPTPPDTASNYAYFPVFVDPARLEDRDLLNERLRRHGIFCRRYFYPLIAEFPMYRGLASASLDNLPVAAALSRQVLCLPMYPALDLTVVAEVCRLIASPGE
jgi:dTDP-4-amino-4,6-dideoxygalactose transaminase